MTLKHVTVRDRDGDVCAIGDWDMEADENGTMQYFRDQGFDVSVEDVHQGIVIYPRWLDMDQIEHLLGKQMGMLCKVEGGVTVYNYGGAPEGADRWARPT